MSCVVIELERLLHRIGVDYGLDGGELVSRYLHPHPPSVPPPSVGDVPSLPKVAPVSAPRPRGRKPSPGLESLDLGRTFTRDDLVHLTIPTLKGICKHRGIKITGSKDQLVARVVEHQSNPDSADVRRKRGGRRSKKAGQSTHGRKAAEPLHTHEIDGEDHYDCPACSHGNPLATTPQEFVVEVEDKDTPLPRPPSPSPEDAPPRSDLSDEEILQERLQQILGDVNTEEEEEEEDHDHDHDHDHDPTPYHTDDHAHDHDMEELTIESF